ncbi:modulator of macroautophagy TMEM150B isoform X1 [Nothobranchius furzeri]|uniref:Transmembrane protein 150B n=3 Tax=Nothobranchius TaxID=28779 RepID=A0A8C6KJH3_NOTFU|nr:transmembrane protein 150B-like [Nothobranchius furzeri]
MWLWALIPVSFGFFGMVGIWTVCAVAVKNGAVNLTRGIPLISTCAAYPPQTSIFSQTFNVVAVLALMTVAIRYKQIQDYGCHGKVNVASVVVGSLAPIGLSVTSNFEASVFYIPHFIGGLVAFVCILTYNWIQVYLTYRALVYKGRVWVVPVRLFCCIISTIMLAGVAFLTSCHQKAFCEWIFVMLAFLLFGLFATEFRHIERCYLTVQMPTLKEECCMPAPVHINHHALHMPC